MRMRAAILDGPRSIKIQDVPVKPPSTGEVLVRLEGSGICGSDLPMWQGRSRHAFPQPPGRPGHEGWGIVSALGPGVDTLNIGDRVSGIFNGAFAELSPVDAERLVKLPRRLDSTRFPGEPLACAVNMFRRSGIQADDTVAIVGIGFVGAVLAQLATHAGARVIAISRREHGLELATRAGVQHALHLHDDVMAYVQDVTEGRLCDIVVEADGQQDTLDLAGRLVRDQGRLVIVGYQQSGPRDVDTRTWRGKGLDVVNAHERDPKGYLDGMRSAVQLVAQGAIDPAPLFTHRFGLEDIGEGFQMLEGRPDGFLKAIVEI